MDQYLRNIVLHKGNNRILKELMKKAELGQRVVIGYLGGSITRGSVASTPEKCYAYQSFLWWREKFPKAESVYVNAGIGATTSHFAVARVEKDLLCENPDLVFVEFSVNDENNEHFMECYEGLIRKILSRKNPPQVVLLHNSFLDSGNSAIDIHGKVGAFYDLPSVSIKSNLYDRIRDGVLKAEAVTSDYLHPNDLGHSMVADTIKYYLELIYSERDVEEKEAILPGKTLTFNRYENAIRLQNDNWMPDAMKGFVIDTSSKKDMTDVFKLGFEGKTKGAFIEFTTELRTLALQYRRTIHKPAPKARVIVDGRTEDAVILDGSFDETWGDLIALTTMIEDEICKKHTIRLEIMDEQEYKSGFYLVSVIQS